MDDVVAISLGGDHSAAIKSDGSLWLWGWNGYYQIGDGTSTVAWAPIEILDGVESVSLGGDHSAAIKSDGSLWTWGGSPNWSFDSATHINRNVESPVPSRVMDDVASVSLGDSHSAALKFDGSVWTWGWNQYGQLGTGKWYSVYDPTQVIDSASAVSLGGNHSAVTKDDGSIWVFGANSVGQLGDGTTINCGTPIKLGGDSGDDVSNDLSQADVYINNEHASTNVSVEWTGRPIDPEISVWMPDDSYFGQRRLAKDVDYTVEFENNTDVGIATLTVLGMGSYTGTKTVQFTISHKSEWDFCQNVYRYNLKDVWSFRNSIQQIRLSMYTEAFGPSIGFGMYRASGNGYSRGVCFGMVAACIASNSYEYPPVDSYKEGLGTAKSLSDIKAKWKGDTCTTTWTSSKTGRTAVEQVMMSQIAYNDPMILNEEADNARKSLDDFAEAVFQSVVNDSEPVAIHIEKDKAGSGSHEVLAVGVGGNSKEKTEVKVYDCNGSNNPTEFSTLVLYKNEDGKYISWSYDYQGSSYSSDAGELFWCTPGDALETILSRNGSYHPDYDTLLCVIDNMKGSAGQNGLMVELDGDTIRLEDNSDERVLDIPLLNAKGDASEKSCMQWVKTGGEAAVSGMTGDCEVIAATNLGGFTCRSKSAKSVVFSNRDSDVHQVRLNQDGESRFEFMLFSDDGTGGTSNLSIVGVGDCTVDIEQDGDEATVVGCSELSITNDDGESSRFVDLDPSEAYTILPGDEETSPEVICDGEEVPAFDQQVVHVAAGSAHAAAILEDGSLWTWGNNDNGQLGDGTYEDKLSPVKIMDDVVAVSLGNEHSGAIKSDGSLWMWGRNKYGSLGDGTTTFRPSPVKVMDGVSQVSCGNGTTAALKEDGTLWVWGFAGLDGLGIGEPDSIYDYLSEPVQLASGVSSVSLGGNVGSYITTSGELFAWGAGANTGSVGTGSKENVYEPTKILDDVVSASMDVTSAAVKADGSLWIWGYQPGVYEPTKVLDGVSSVSVGFNFVVAHMRDGSLQTYGVNDHGQLGNGSDGSSSASFAKVCDGMAMSDAGSSFGLSVDVDGTLYTWGYNNHGQLGIGTTDSIATVTATVSGSAAPMTQTNAIDMSSATVSGVSDIPYTGSFVTQPVVVTLDGKALEEGWDYSVDYKDNIEVGEASVTVKGKGVYTGTVTASFNVTAADISGATVSEVDDQVYTGSAITPAIRVRMNGRTLFEGEDYTLAYADNVEAGAARVTVTGMGNYTGTVVGTFAIVPAKPEALRFSDVTASTDHHEDIEWLALQGISRGWDMPDGTVEFRPYASVTRADMAAFLFRLAKGWGLVDESWQPSGRAFFRDVSAKTAHYREVMWLAEVGISEGWTMKGGAKEFRPYANVARADMAAFLFRLARLAGRADNSWQPNGASPFTDVKAGTAHYREVVWLAKTKVSAGWTMKDGTRQFRPYANVARADMAAFLHRLEGVVQE